MTFSLKSKSPAIFLTLLGSALLLGLLLFWSLRGSIWTRADSQILDLFYRQALQSGFTPHASAPIVYLSLTDESYEYFGKNVLDRSDLAKINETLVQLNPEAVAYDIIFAHPSEPAADRRFAESVKTLGKVYLPLAFELSEQERHFLDSDKRSFAHLQDHALPPLREGGRPQAFSAVRSLMQLEAFADASYGSGHINSAPDPDGIHRHQALLVKVGSLYFPSLSFAMFLDYAGVSSEQIRIDWGRAIHIPADAGKYLEEDLVVPIDRQGRSFIPFPQTWGNDFPNMSAHNLLEYAKDVNLHGNLTEFFEGKFVLIGDLPQGATDIGPTTLEENVPLIATHAALLNAFITQSFYESWSQRSGLLFLFALGLLLILSAAPRKSWGFYSCGTLLLVGLIGFCWFEIIHFRLFPIVTLGGSMLVLFIGLTIGQQVISLERQAFIRDAFAKFVPETVVAELLSHPEKLTLGGEERELSILFADLQNFTSISEQLPPQQLVRMLNEFLSEMTHIILEEGGTIDKYFGDAIMAEFGAPLPRQDHADRAVTTALKMQRRLRELQKNRAQQQLPALKCRIGINTGSVIVGNMGADRFFDYTVIGDAVNLASRLEDANKRYQTSLMISEFTHQALTPGRFLSRPLDVIRVKGKQEAVKVFEVYGESSDSIEPELLNYYQSYQKAFEAYLAQDFTLALEKFAATLQYRPDDPVSKKLIARIVTMNQNDLPESWDGAIQM